MSLRPAVSRRWILYSSKGDVRSMKCRSRLARDRDGEGVGHGLGVGLPLVEVHAFRAGVGELLGDVVQVSLPELLPDILEVIGQF